MKTIKSALVLLSLSLLLGACTKAGYEDEDSDNNGDGDQTVPDDSQDLIDTSIFTNAVTVNFYKDSIVVVNPFVESGVSVSVSGNDVTATSTAENIQYVLAGSRQAASFKLYSDYAQKITLYGLEITGSTAGAINIQSKERTYIEVSDDHISTIADASAYTESDSEDMKGTIFSEGALVFNGEGTLNIKSNAKHAICSDKYVRILSGTTNITAAASDGIHSNDAIVIDGGNLSVKCSGDGLDVETGYIEINGGSINIASEDEGMITSYEGTSSSIQPYISINGGSLVIRTSGTSAKGIKSMGNLTIADGVIAVTTTQSESEGIESKKTLTINGGTIIVSAVDDAINAKNSIVVNGGKIYAYSTTNDGMDSNGTFTFTGGLIISIGSSAPEEGFDCDQNSFIITGGTLIGIGGATSTPTTRSCTQPSIIYSGSSTQNSLIHIESSTGDEVMTFKLPKTLSQMTMLFSSPLLSSGSTYKIYTGGSCSADDFNGYYETGGYTAGSSSTSVTLSSMVTTAGSNNSTPGGGRW